MKTLVLFSCLCIYHASALFGEPRIEPHAEITQECLNEGAIGSCGFYQCMENRFPCGHRGFAIHQGLHFCNRTAISRNNFDVMGQRWLDRTAKCITSHLLPVYNAYVSRCGDIRDAGVDAMLTCNTRQDPDGTDFCTFVRSNFDAYEDLFGSSEVIRIMRLRSPRLFASMVTESLRCGAEEIQTVLDQAEGLFNSEIQPVLDQAEGFFSSVANTLRERWNSFWN